MKTSILFTFLILSFLSLHAQEEKDSMLYVNFLPVDGFYEKPLEKARVSLFEADSVTLLVDSGTPIYNSRGFMGFYFFAPRRAAIVVKVECEGYPITFIRQQVTNKKGKIPAKFVFETSFRIWPGVEMEQQLGEATVNASRILMVMKGDTIEYNAAAFRMAEGSMLDNLVRALPGVKLDDEGKITVNGEFVKSLLVNGRDFFKGDPKVALSNLPAYTVNKVKVYHQESERDKYRADRTAEERKKDPLVMDVVLKREYAKGWISNYEVAGGSNLKGGFDERWLARLFAMRYTNHSSLAVYANANNLNDDASPGSKGEWKKIDPAAGEKKTYKGGIDFTLEPKDSELKFNTSLQAQRQETFNETHTARESYYSSGNTFENSASSGKNTATDLKWQANVKINKHLNDDVSINLYLIPSAYYSHNKQRSDSQTHSLQQEGTGTLDSLYTRSLQEFGRETKWGVSGSASGFIFLPHVNSVDYSFNAQYNHTDRNGETADSIGYATRLLKPSVLQGRQTARPAFDYSYGGSLSVDTKGFGIGKTSWRPLLGYTYLQTFNSGHQDRQLRDGELLTPSTISSGEWRRDEMNSWHTTRMERVQTIKPALWFDFKPIHIRLDFPMNIVARRIDDFRESTPRHKSFHDFNFNPSFYFSWSAGEQLGSFSYTHSGHLIAEIENQLPDLLYLLDVRDTSDPMNLYQGNAELRTTKKYHFVAGYEFRKKEYAQMLRFRAAYDIYDNAVSMAQLYDRTTGVTTHLPLNIDGNREATASLSYTRFLDKNNQWNLSLSTEFRHARSVDFADDAQQEFPQSLAAKNISQRGTINLYWYIGKVSLSTNASITWTRMRSESHAFGTFNYTECNYGFRFAAPLRWGLDLSTDLTAHFRRGYADTSLNATDWVWNAQLSRALGKRKQWVVKATGFDLLHQISNIRRTVNAQGRTETWYNTIPAYATLHVVFRLNVLPKRKGIGEKEIS